MQEFPNIYIIILFLKRDVVREQPEFCMADEVVCYFNACNAHGSGDYVFRLGFFFFFQSYILLVHATLFLFSTHSTRRSASLSISCASFCLINLSSYSAAFLKDITL